MKKITLLLLALVSLQVHAQEIAGITMVPSSPDDNDTIRFYVYLDFPQSGCDGFAVHSSVGSTILASSSRCMGFMMTLCNDVDTIVLNPRPAGVYNLVYTLSAGMGGPPCSPPFVPNDEDTLTFTVSSTTSVNTLGLNNSFAVFPNPSTSGFVTIELTGYPAAIMVLNELGQLVEIISINTSRTQVHLNPGIYIFAMPETGTYQRVIVTSL